MPRSLVIRSGDPPNEHLIDENSIPTEAALHEVLMRHPALVPASDLGFERMVTVGFEAGLASGIADLVLLDVKGRLCVVEVKKEGNPDTRRVVAQLLDYASALWGMTLADFECQVLRSGLGRSDPRTLSEFIAQELVDDAEEDVDALTEQVLDGLSETLRRGDFALVVAAPVIPEGVQRAIEYLNARGLSMYGLEVSYFAGDVEAFVPRVVVRPTVSARIVGQADMTTQAIDPHSFFDQFDSAVGNVIRAGLNSAVAGGGELQWRPYGPRVRARGQVGPKVIVSVDSGTAYIAVGARKGVPNDLRVEIINRLGQLGGVQIGTDNATIRLVEPDLGTLSAFFEIGADFVRRIVS